MGSVKDLEIIKEPAPFSFGSGNWTFTDRYSVFNLKEMPDDIPYAGASRALMAAWNMEKAQEEGVATTYEGMIEDGEALRLPNLEKPSNVMRLLLVRTMHPEFRDRQYDYSFFAKNRGETDYFLLPIEFIFRNGLPQGSSVFDDIARARESDDKDYIQKLLANLGLEEIPEPGAILPKPYCDFTTKFEDDDRKIPREEAIEISGVAQEDFEEAERVRDAANRIVTKRCRELGWIHYDGKAEIYRGDGRIGLADVFGTFDENRFYVEGIDPTKEFLRQWYRKNQPGLLEGIKEAKEEARKKGGKDFKAFLRVKPVRLPQKLLELAGEVYQAGTNAYTGRRFFDVRPFPEAVGRLKEFSRKE